MELLSSSSKTVYINYNGAIIRSDKGILTADNRSFRYGDGLFETMKVVDSCILLENFHFERLLHGTNLLGFNSSPALHPTHLRNIILELCKRNGHSRHARVRLVVFRGEYPDSPGGLSGHLNGAPPDYLIQTWPLPGEGIAPHLPEEGWVIDLFPDARKSCDPFSNLKSNNYLVYALASLYARRHGWNDCMVLNHHGRIADSSIANVFFCKNDCIYTPPLSEGCVAGVMRRFLVETLPKAGFGFSEKETTTADLESADELFLTNSIRELRWVHSFRGQVYGNKMAQAIYRQLIAPGFH